MPGSSSTGGVFHVFADESARAENRHGKKHGSGNFQPQLMACPGERPCGSADCSSNGTQRAATSGLLVRDSRHNTRFSPGRNFSHALDFNSLWRYNDSTPEHSATVAPPLASNVLEPFRLARGA